MGTSLSQLKGSTKNLDETRKTLYSVSLDKIVEWHCKFRTNCSKFTINQTEFKEIFGSDDLYFEIWDPNQTGIIDGLELFTGIILLAKINFEDQIKFLFDLYDFNELNSLSQADIELLAKLVISSLFKIFKLRFDPEVDEIFQVISRLAEGKNRMNFSQIHNFFLHAQEVHELYTNIGKPSPCPKQISEIDETREREDPKSSIPAYLRDSPSDVDHTINDFLHGGLILNSKQNKTKIKVLSSFAGSQVPKDQVMSPIRSSKLNLNWVYGFSCDRSVRSFIVSTAGENDNSIIQCQNKILFSVSNIVVVFYYKYTKQSHFMEHTNEVCSISISRSGKICASGQKGKSPKIFIWLIDTLKTISVINLESDNEAYLIEFINDDKYLISLCKRPDPAIQIHNIQNNTLVTSTYISEFVLMLSPIRDLSGRLNKEINDATIYNDWNIGASFACITESKIYLFALSESTKTYSISVVEAFDKNHKFSNNPAKITGGTVMYANMQNPESVMYKSNADFGLLCYCCTNQGKIIKVRNILSEAKTYPPTIELNDIPKCGSFTSLIYFKEKFLCAVSEDQQIFIIDLLMNNVYQHIDIKSLDITLRSLQIKNVERGDNGKLFFSTWKGDIFALTLSKKHVWNQKQINNIVKVKQFETIFKIEKGYSSICLIERSRKEKCIYISGSKNNVHGFSTVSRELSDLCTFEDTVTCMDCFTQTIGGIIFAFGTDKGKIRVRFDSELVPKFFQYEKSISVLKFSDSGAYLIAGTTEPSILLFVFLNGTYFHDPPKIVLNHENPISINFCTNLNEFILGTDLLKYYHIKISEFKEKRMYEMRSGDSVKCNLIQTKYVTERHKHRLPVIIVPDLGTVITGEKDGIISFYDSISNLKDNCGTFYYGHCSYISALKLSNYRDKLYSIAINDGGLFEWNVDLVPSVAASNLTNDVKQIEAKPNDEPIASIKRQIIANSIVKYRPSIIHDSFGYFRSYSNNYLRRIFGEKFDSFDENENLHKRYPQFSLNLKHVYGYDAYNYRNNVLYLHSKSQSFDITDPTKNKDSKNKEANGSFITSFRPSEMKQPEIVSNFANLAKKINQIHKISLAAKKLSSSNLVKKFSYQLAHRNTAKSIHKNAQDLAEKKTCPSSCQTNDFYSQHFGPNCKGNRDIDYYYNDDPSSALVTCSLPANQCHREIVYFVSRIAVIIDPNYKDNQRFYQGHTAKISSVTLHPTMPIVATGETCHQPKIHIWQIETCSTITIIETFHKLGIICLKFTYGKGMIISVSVDNCSSIQVSDWHTGKVIAFRNTSTKKIIDMAVDPSDPHSFVTANVDRLDFWMISGSSIINSHFLDFDDMSVKYSFTNMIYMAYWSQGQFQKDLLATTSDARLIVIRNQKFLKSINLSIDDYESETEMEEKEVTARTYGERITGSFRQNRLLAAVHRMSENKKLLNIETDVARQRFSQSAMIPPLSLNSELKEQKEVGDTSDPNNSFDIGQKQKKPSSNNNKNKFGSKEFKIVDEESGNENSAKEDNSSHEASRSPRRSGEGKRQSKIKKEAEEDDEMRVSQVISKKIVKINNLRQDNENETIKETPKSRNQSINFESSKKESNADERENTELDDSRYSKDQDISLKEQSLSSHKDLSKKVRTNSTFKHKVNLIKMIVIRNQSFIVIASDDNLVQIYNLNIELVFEIVIQKPVDENIGVEKEKTRANQSKQDASSNRKSKVERSDREASKSMGKQKKKSTFNNATSNENRNSQNIQKEFDNLHISMQQQMEKQKKRTRHGVQSIDMYLQSHNLLLLISLSIGTIIELNLIILFTKNPVDGHPDLISFSRKSVTNIMECHASQNFSGLDNEFNFIYHKRVYISVNPIHNIIATCGDDMYLHFWDFETKRLLLSRKLDNVPTCIKFSPLGKILVIGLLNGHVMVMEPDIHRDQRGQRSVLKLKLEKPVQVIDPVLKTTSKDKIDDLYTEKPVLNVEFSLKGDLLAVAHDNVKLNDKKDNLKDRGTAIVIVYVSKDSDLKSQALQAIQDNYFIKYADVRLASLNYADTSKMSYLGMASYFMAFSDDDTYLMLYYQNINEHHIRENQDKEGKYVIWNFKSRSSEINWEILKNVQFKSNNFPNHIYGINSYTITDKLDNNISIIERAKFNEEIKNNSIVLSAISNFGEICFLGSDMGDLFIAKKTLFALKQKDSPENLPRSSLCQAKRYRAHSSFVNQIEISSNGKSLFTTGISDECILEWHITNIEAKNDLDHLPSNEIKHIEKEQNRFLTNPNESENQSVAMDPVTGLEMPITKEVNEPNASDFAGRNFNVENSEDQSFTIINENPNRTMGDTTLKNPQKSQNESSFKSKEQSMHKVYLTNDKPKQKFCHFSYDSRSRFDSLVTEVYPRRKRIGVLMQSIDISSFPLFRLTLQKVIGRNAMKARPNLSVILNKFLIYSAGTALVINDLTKIGMRSTKEEPNSIAVDHLLENKFIKNRTASIEDNQHKNFIENNGFKKSNVKRMSTLMIEDKGDSMRKSIDTESDENEESMKDISNQNILFAGQSQTGSYPSEISCFELASDGRTICVGTNDIQSSLLVWEITSYTFKGSITLSNCISPQFIRFSSDMNAVIVLGLVKNYNSCMYFVDIQNYKVLAMMDLIHSPTFKIWDASFIPGRNDKFISVGLVHSSFWKYRAETLEFKELKLESPISLDDNPRRALYEQTNDEEHLITCFLIIKFLSPDIFVTSCSKGIVYVWSNHEIRAQRTAYSNSPVSAVAVHPDRPFDFLIGGFKVPIHYYRVKKNNDFKTIDKLFEINIFASGSLNSLQNTNVKEREDQASLPEYQIQSLLFSQNDRVIYGTRNGNLGEFHLMKEVEEITAINSPRTQNDTSHKKDKSEIIEFQTIVPDYNSIFFSVFDNQIPRVADFSHDCSMVYCVSEQGLFLAYEFATLTNVFRHDFDRLTQDMIVLEKSIIFVFENKIKVIKKKDNNYELDKSAIKLVTKSRQINKVKVHLYHSLMAIAFEAQGDNVPIIEIYNIDSAIYEKFYTIETEQIELMDFSSEDYTQRDICSLMCQEVRGKMSVFKIEKDKVTTDNNDKIDWASEGLMISTVCKKFREYYSPTNLIVSILKIDPETLVVNDELGTVW
jgi:WD40 repeat protein